MLVFSCMVALSRGVDFWSDWIDAALDHAHVEHLLKRLDGLEGAPVGRAGAAVVLGEAVGVSGDRQPGSGLKSRFAKPSTKEKLDGSSTAVICQYPNVLCRRPVGPVHPFAVVRFQRAYHFHAAAGSMLTTRAVAVAVATTRPAASSSAPSSSASSPSTPTTRPRPINRPVPAGRTNLM